MKYLFITLDVQDGERKHTHRILHATKGNNIEFAAQRYVSNFWGNGERQNKEDDFWWFFGEITCRLSNVVEISEYEYKLMSDIFGGRLKDTNYFQIVHAGHCEASNREEIQIHAGENGNVFLHQDDGKLGFIVDVYGQNDLADSMTVWEEDLIGDEIDPVKDAKEIKAYLKGWGQKHGEITANLDYPRSHAESDELLMENYFFLEGRKEWYPKLNRMYSKREQLIADYVRNNRDNY
jgi:hypothetical protein